MTLPLLALAPSCGGSAHVLPQRAYAQAVVVNCGPTDSTVSCCIKKHPGAPEACGLTPSDAADILNGVKVVSEAMPQEVPRKEDGMPGWKKRCIDAYVACKEESWTGSCYDCFRYCEGQQDWPIEQCFRRKTR
jgi:hypothetical protein